tara:strand:- start:1887 stop:2225 length:339 start_codon:yes stop_codon:yes gene_type:complete
VDLWPYINGKAITLGLDLEGMEMSPMLDVIHFFFEEDSRYASGEEAEAVSKMRTQIYSGMYGTTYKYAVKSSSSKGASGFGDDMELKPYIPPTEVDIDSPQPYGSVLDAPIG